MVETSRPVAAIATRANSSRRKYGVVVPESATVGSSSMNVAVVLRVGGAMVLHAKTGAVKSAKKGRSTGPRPVPGQSTRAL